MVRPRRTARKSTGHLPVGQLAPRDAPPQQEPHHDSPQNIPQEEEEEPFEVVVVAPEEQEPQGAMAEELQLPQDEENDANNNDNHNDENHDEEEEDEGEEYTPLSDSENEKLYHDADELKSFGNEAPIPTGRL
jgi:hypothetical protein